MKGGGTMIKITGQYQLTDYLAAQHLHARQNLRLGAIMVILVLIFLVELALSALQALPWSLTVTAAFLVAIMALYLYVLRPAQLKRLFNQQKELSSPFEMELTDEGYGFSNAYGSGRFPWKDFAKYQEGPDIFLLYRADNLFNMLPKRLLETDVDARFVRDRLIQNGVPTKTRNRSLTTFRLIVIGLLIFLAIAAMVYFNIRAGSR
jgi:hypothetical protein